MSKRCGICGGARIVRLRVQQPMVGSQYISPADSFTAPESSRAYPCPECAVSAPIDRVYLVESSVMVYAREFEMLKGDPLYVDCLKRDAVHTLAHKLLDGGFMRWERGNARSFDGIHPDRIEFIATVAVAKKADAVSIGNRIRQGFEQAMASLAQRIAKISASDLCRYPAIDIINQAMREVRAELERKDEDQRK